MFKLHSIRPKSDAMTVALDAIQSKVGGLDLEKLLFKSIPRMGVITGTDGIPLIEPTMFLLDRSLRSRSVNGDTVRTYGESIVKWMRHLNKVGLTLDSATEEAFGGYRSDLANGGNQLTSSTVNLNVAVAVQLHLWGAATGKMKSPFGDFLIERKASLQSNLYGSQAHIRNLSPRVVKRIPQFISEEHRNELMAEAKSPFKLMFKWATVSGLRRHEICNLKISSLPKNKGINNLEPELCSLTLLRKGGKETTVYVPWKLIEETIWYIDADRPTPTLNEIEFVFLNRRGNRFAREAVSREFRRAASKVGCIATLHHLRHTYAITLLYFLQRAAANGDEINPMKTLQVLMGHSSIESTEIYLAAAALGGKAVEQSLLYLYGKTDDDESAA